MVLSDKDLLNRIQRFKGDVFAIGIEPFDEGRVQPASVDLLLDDEFMTYPVVTYMEESGRNVWHPDSNNFITKAMWDHTIDLADAKNVEMNHFRADKHLLMPEEIILASTVESVSIPRDIVARVEGKSSLGRLGLLIHATAGFIDPGFKGKITLEMKNLNNRPIMLRAGLAICQLSFLLTMSPARYPYGHEKLDSKYQNQEAVTASRYEG